MQRAFRCPLARPVYLFIPISNTDAQAAFYRACAPRLAELAASLGLDAAGPSSGGSSAGGGANGAHAPAAAASSGDLTSDLGPQISWCWAPQPVVVEAAPPRHFLFVLGDLRAAFPQQPHAYDLEVRLCALCVLCGAFCAPNRHSLRKRSYLKATCLQQPHAYDLEVRLCALCVLCVTLCAPERHNLHTRRYLTHACGSEVGLLCV